MRAKQIPYLVAERDVRIRSLEADNALMASHIRGWTPDYNTQTAADVEATEALIRAAVDRAFAAAPLGDKP